MSRQSQLKTRELRLREIQQRQEWRREMAEQRAEHHIKSELPVRYEPHVRNVEDRAIAEELMRRRARRHRCDDERTEAFHRRGAEHDLGYEQRAGNRCVI